MIDLKHLHHSFSIHIHRKTSKIMGTSNEKVLGEGGADIRLLVARIESLSKFQEALMCHAGFLLAVDGRLLLQGSMFGRRLSRPT